jgi:hypothetical protein
MSDLRNLIIGAMLDALDDNMLAKHYADIEQMADEALAAVAPLIRRAALEEAAGVAEAFPARTHGALATAPYAAAEQAAEEIAAAIRALDT